MVTRMPTRIVAALGVALGILILAAGSSAEPIDLRASKRVEQMLDSAIADLGKGNLKQADATLQELLKEDPTHVYALLARAQIAVNEGRIAAADRSVTSVLERQQQLPEAHNMRGVVLLLQKRNEEAAKAFRRALELRPNYVTPRFYLAAIARSKGDHAEAAREYKALADAAPRIPAGYLGQAEAYMMLRNPAEAFRILQAWKSVPQSGPLPYQVIANVYLAQKEQAKALQELQAAVAKYPSDTGSLTYLGDAYLATKDTTKAMASYRLAIKADARNAVATNNLAWLLMERAQSASELGESLSLAEAAVKIEPNYVDALDTLGLVHYRRADYAKAIAELSKARKLAPTRMDIAAHLGLAYAKAGSKPQALTELRAALASKTPIANRAELERVVKELGSTQ
jgi:tetratricopeptide (TPR) repeat protein